MGFLKAVGGFFTGAASAIAGGASAVFDAVKALYHLAVGVFDLVGGAWDWMVNGLGWLGNNLIGGMARLLHLLEWVALHAIPEGLAWAFHQGVRFARKAVHDALTFALAALHTVEHWTVGQLAHLWHWATSETRRLWGVVTSVWNWIERTARHAVNLVLHPDRLAAWILGSLVLPLARFAIESSAPIIVWAFKRASTLMPALAHTLEDALAKLI